VRLVVIRHAIAVPRGTSGYEDADRPLTDRGVDKFRAAAAGLARVLDRPDAILTSPWVRARDTALLAARAWDGPGPIETESLTRDDPKALAGDLARYPDGATVALVGHEPYLSSLLSRLLGSGAPDRIEFKKGGAALVEIEKDLASGGHLIWFLPPRILRALAGR